MRVLGLTWVGIRTDAYGETVGFFRDVMGLGVDSSADGLTVLQVLDGATVEVFGPASPWNKHLTHPAAGFLVADLDEAVEQLEAAGAEIVLPVQRAEARAWVHFRAPDGFVYELVEDGSGH